MTRRRTVWRRLALPALAALAVLLLASGQSQLDGRFVPLSIPGLVSPAEAQRTGVRRRVIKPTTQRKRRKLRRQTTTSTPTQPTPTQPTPKEKKRVVKPTTPKVVQPKVLTPILDPKPPRDAAADSALLPPDVRAYLKQVPAAEYPPGADLATRSRAGEVIVMFSQLMPQPVLDGIAQQYGLTYVDGTFVELLGADIHRFAFDPVRPLADVISALQADGRPDDAYANFVFSVQGSAEKIARDEAQMALQYALAKLRVPDAHKRATGKTVKIAVIDTLVDAEHPELEGATVTVFDAVAGTQGDADPHGTAITGIIAAQKSLRGVAPRAEILAARAFVAVDGGLGEADTMSLVRAMDWAEQQGARVFNMSFAGPEDALLIKLIEAAHARGIVMVAASGNAGPQSPPLYPAAHDHVIAVTATDFTDKLYKRANQGAHITLAAPGVDILVMVPEGKFGMMSGTSLATAHISGLAALLLEGNPDLSPAEITALITESAHDLGTKGTDPQFGAGRADAVDALDQGAKLERVSSQ